MEGSSMSAVIYGEIYKNFYSKSKNCKETYERLKIIKDCYINLYDYITEDNDRYWNYEKEKFKRYPKYFLKLLLSEYEYVSIELNHYEMLLHEDV